MSRGGNDSDMMDHRVTPAAHWLWQGVRMTDPMRAGCRRGPASDHSGRGARGRPEEGSREHTLPVTVLVLGRIGLREKAGATRASPATTVFGGTPSTGHAQSGTAGPCRVQRAASSELALAWLPAQQVHVCPSLADESTG